MCIHKANALGRTSNNGFDGVVNNSRNLSQGIRERRFVARNVIGIKILQLDDAVSHFYYHLQKTGDMSFWVTDIEQSLKLKHIFGERIGGMQL